MNLGKSVCIYGAGSNGRRIHDVVTKQGVEVVAFLDMNAAQLAGKLPAQVVRPDSDEARQLASRASAVIVAVFNRQASLRDIDGILERAGFKNVMHFVEFFREFHAQWGWHFWLSGAAPTAEAKDALAWLGSLLADEHSKRVFDKLVAVRNGAPSRELPPGQGLADQYFPLNLPGWLEGAAIELIDCGAYDGDTLQALLEQKRTLKSLVAFEPDPENFRKLSKLVSGIRGVESATLLPCGVWSATEQLRFSAGAGEGSRVDSKGDSMIQVCAIDDVSPVYAPNFIKMDIEGAEPDALRGAARIIGKHKPSLAVSLYHQPDHLWSLPKLIHSLNPDYRYYIRAHGECGIETVLYCN